MTETSYTLPGVNVLLMGPSGTGKTFSIGTLVDLGYEVFFLAMESGMESLLGYWADRGKPVPDNLHWHILEAPEASFEELIDAATKVNTLNLDALSKMIDPNKRKHNQFIKLLESMCDFPDDRTGETFGAVDTWSPSRVLVVDGLTGISNAVMSLVIGGKPVRNQSEWGIAQGQVENLLRKFTDSCRCHFVLIAHIEREADEVLGGLKLMVSTLGKKLAPKIAPMFSDVILCEREGTTWNWNTASSTADVKTRNLSFTEKNRPDFGPIFSKWESRNKTESI